MNTDKWTSQIDRTTEVFKREFGALTPEELNRKPNPTTWSIAQNIDHLIVTNGTYYPIIKSVREGSYKTPFTGKIGFMVNMFGKLVLNAVQPGTRKKIKTFPIWEPSTSNIPADILARFEKSQAEMKQMITGCADLLDKRTVISSPANRNIVYKLEDAFNIIVTHQLRHFEQAKEVISR